MSEYNLERFVSVQKGAFELALREIRSGQKYGHWMWYIFPQLRALGQSGNSIYYGIADLEEAKAYMENQYLQANLIAMSRALLELDVCDPLIVMGYPDNLKLCSCMTLFELAAPDVCEFGMVLDKFYDGKRDDKTINLLKM